GLRDDEEARFRIDSGAAVAAAPSHRPRVVQALARGGMTAMPGSFLDAEFLGRLGTIVVIDLLLAGDNALVIALAVRSLPARQQLVGRIFGTAGAVVLRVALIALATALLTIPFMQLVGGLALVGIAVKLVRQPAGDGAHGRAGRSLYHAIGIIVFAD